MRPEETKVKEELKQLASAVGEVVPQKEHKKSTHMGFGTVTDPKVGAATAIKPGEVRNPGGRPKKKLISEAYAEVLMELFPDDRKRRTYARLIAEGQAKAAIKGKTDAAREIADRVEGKVRPAFEVEEIGGTQVQVNQQVNIVSDGGDLASLIRRIYGLEHDGGGSVPAVGTDASR